MGGVCVCVCCIGFTCVITCGLTFALTTPLLLTRYGPAHNSQLLFDYKISTLVCAGEGGPHCAKAIVKKFLEYRKGSSCHCG